MRVTIVLLSLFVSVQLTAQKKQTTNLEQVWLGYLNQTRLSKHWGVWVDVQYRTRDDFFSKASASIFRAGITRYINDVTKITAGYSYVSLYPANNKVTVTQPEHRPWQQIQWHTRYGKNRMMQYIRLEERYRHNVLNDSTLGTGYNFNFRLRYNFLWQVPLKKGKDLKQGDVSFVLNDEVHVNFGKQIVYNYFDQNRFFAGLAYQVNATDNIQFGYLNVFQQLASGSSYRNIHAARIFYFHNLDLRK